MHRPPHRYHAPDRVELVKLCIGRLETAWNHKNAVLWASAFTEPCQYIDAFGTFHPNWTRAENAALHERSWSTAFQKSHAQFAVVSIEFTGDHTCISVLRGMVHQVLAEEERVVETHITAVLIHDGQEWLIRNFQNTIQR